MKFKLKLITILLVPVIILLNIISRSYPEFIERYYSTSVNKMVRQLLSKLTNVFPFALAEFLVIFLVLILLYLFIKLIFGIKKESFPNRLLNIITFVSALYIIFMFLWGFNYNRLSFDKISGLKLEKASKKELYELCEELIDKANVLRGGVTENSNRVMVIQGGYKGVFQRAAKGYESISQRYPELGGNYGKPKPILLSKKMSYTGITGIYMPYTGEANVNVNVTDFTLPATVLHEMAHQRGFAREDEANYIAYIACKNHPDLDFQYSGVMLALVHTMNTLAEVDIEAYKNLRENYSEGVVRDLKCDVEFWNKYRGNIEEISNKVNDKYLKSNGQADGVESYGRMVDLLIAEHKLNK